MLVYFLLPLAWLLISATKSNADLFDSFGLWFGHRFSLMANLRLIFTYDNGVYVDWLRNTVFYSVTSAAGAAVISTAAGYAFAKFSFPGRRIWLGVILISVAVPVTILIVPLFLLLSRMDLVNTPWAFILPSMVQPFGVYLMLIFAAESLPNEVLEAARVDGASEGYILRKIVLPLLVPGFVTVLLFSFVASWNNYFLPLLVFSKPSFFPLTVGLADWNSQAAVTGGAGYATDNMVIAGSLVAILPLIVAFLFLQRYWQEGLTLGSIKG
jgi:multiple sugar transport system permease protein